MKTCDACSVTQAQHAQHRPLWAADTVCVACKACMAHLAISQLLLQLADLFEGRSLIPLQLLNLLPLGGQSILQGCFLLLVLLLVADG